MFFTGVTRSASKVLGEIDFEKSNSIINEMTRGCVEFVKEIKEYDLVNLANKIAFSWSCKKRISPSATNKDIDELYNSGLSCGALGGKLLGAGGGGFMFFLCKSVVKKNIKSKLNEKYQELDFKFIDNGTQIVFSDSEE